MLFWDTIREKEPSRAAAAAAAPCCYDEENAMGISLKLFRDETALINHSKNYRTNKASKIDRWSLFFFLYTFGLVLYLCNTMYRS